MHNIITGLKVTWIDIQNPTQEDVDFLRQQYHIHPLVLGELVPPAWRTKVEVFPNYLFFIFYYPAYTKSSKQTRPRELDVIVGKDLLITSHYNSIVPLKALFDKCNIYEEHRRDHLAQTGMHLLFHAMNDMRQSTLLKLDRINKKLNHIEEQVFKGKEREMLQEISYAKADILNFWRIVDPQGEVLESLRKEGNKFFGQELEPYFMRLIGDWSLAKNNLEADKEAVEALEQTNNSLLTDKTNEIVKILTMFSVIVFPLTLLAAIFGMNTLDLPLTGYSGDFWIISAIMVVGILGMIGFFKYKKWL